jgi:hypothetical protein
VAPLAPTFSSAARMTVAASGLLPAGPLDELFLHIEVVIDKGLDRLVDGDRQWISKTEQPGCGSRDGLATAEAEASADAG